jgi:hypothetical protein
MRWVIRGARHILFIDLVQRMGGAYTHGVDELQVRSERAAESILENERLTADLDDAAAGALLEWALACSEMIVSETAGMPDGQAEEVMAPRLKATRRMMRNVNRLVGAGPPDEAVSKDRLGKIAAQAQIVYGREIVPPDAEAWRRVIAEGDGEGRIRALKLEIEGRQGPATEIQGRQESKEG